MTCGKRSPALVTGLHDAQPRLLRELFFACSIRGPASGHGHGARPPCATSRGARRCSGLPRATASNTAACAMLVLPHTMEQKHITCPETGHLEEIEIERTPVGLVN